MPIVFCVDCSGNRGKGLKTRTIALVVLAMENIKRPDLSNTSMFIDALKDLGAADDDPAIQAAIRFVSRTQNLESSHNPTKFGAKVNDGSFFYTPAGEGESKAGTETNGGLRGYASMTYAGFKSLLYSGVSKDDVRVQAAKDWITKHYDLNSNPGMGQQGLFYYYHIFAKALDALGEDEFVEADGTRHNWRAELVEVLADKQKEDGSWINDADRWYEGSPNLCAAYSLLALAYCKPEAEKPKK